MVVLVNSYDVVLGDDLLEDILLKIIHINVFIASEDVLYRVKNTWDNESCSLFF